MVQQFTHSANGGTGCWIFLRRTEIHNSPEGHVPGALQNQVLPSITTRGGPSRIVLKGQQAKKSPPLKSGMKRQAWAPHSGPRTFFHFFIEKSLKLMEKCQ